MSPWSIGHLKRKTKVVYTRAIDTSFRVTEG